MLHGVGYNKIRIGCHIIQVRRMLHGVGSSVIELRRTHVGRLCLGELAAEGEEEEEEEKSSAEE